MIRVKHWLETVSFYLGLGLLLYTLNQTNPPQVILSGVNGNDVGDGLQTVRSRFDSYSTSSDCFPLKIEETYTFMNICWAEISRDFRLSVVWRQ